MSERRIIIELSSVYIECLHIVHFSTRNEDANMLNRDIKVQECDATDAK